MKLSQALEVSPPDRKHQVKGIKKHMAQCVKNMSVVQKCLSSKKYKATSGCIALLKKDFLKIIPLINKKTKIAIS